jgi:hypothetical protein
MSEEAPVISRRTFARLAAAALPILGTEPLAGAQARSSSDDKLESEFLMRLRFEYPDVIPGSPQSAGLPGMRRTIIEISRGTFEGPKLKGTVIPPSGEWSYGYGKKPFGPEVRLTLRTDDDQLIFMQYRGIIDRGVNPTYWRAVPWFEAGSGKYAWLNNRIYIGVGHFPAGATRVAEYCIYQIV